MKSLNISIPNRLKTIRVVVTIALIVSFLLSFNLWVGNTIFPDAPAFDFFHLTPIADTILMFCSVVSLICSLFLYKHRLFLFFSISINIILVLSDLNRLQPWFYIYNAILIVLMFYNGRVDDSNKFTYIFITIQTILASIYLSNGLNQLNPNFLQSDFFDIISPLSYFSSERQFIFFMKAGRVVPFVIIFIGIGFLIRPMRYLSVPVSILFHLTLFILLFPTSKNSNYALWLMNLVFALLILLMFTGKTKERYFSPSILLQKPLFYSILFTFWIIPILNYANYWPKSPTTNFKYGNLQNREITISENTYHRLQHYLKHFCSKNNNNYSLKINEWCRHELRSEYLSHVAFHDIFKDEMQQITSTDVKDSEEELSSL